MNFGQLKEVTIIETFRSLEPERQRYLLEQLVRETKLTSVTMKFEKEEHERLHKFASKQWPMMSLEFFQQIRDRWEFLCTKSYGNEMISSAEIGDLYLQSKRFDDPSYDDFPFGNMRGEFFYKEVFENCNWDHMYISMLFPGNVWCTNYLIRDLMELSEEDYITKMEEYGFIV